MYATIVEWIRWTPHPETWLLIGSVIAFGGYTAKVIEPKAVAAGEPPISARQRAWFVAGVLLLWFAADWPLHDLGEDYLYALHMLQHLIITFVVPPVFLLAMPAWLFRFMIGDGGFKRFFTFMSKPLPAAIFYNLVVILTHWSVTVRLSVTNGPVHFLLHLIVFGSALLAWTPVCAPAPEYRCSRPAAMIYLFCLSVIPTIPGGWLANAEGVVYPVYDREPRLWGISVTEDQQMAGVTMKVVGGFYLWALITVIFFKWMNAERIKDGSGSARYRGKLVSPPDSSEFVLAQVGGAGEQDPDSDSGLGNAAGPGDSA